MNPLAGVTVNLLLLCAVAFAADPPSAQKNPTAPQPDRIAAMIEKYQPKAPACELKFKVSDIPITKKMVGNDPVLFQQKFCASFSMRVPLPKGQGQVLGGNDYGLWLDTEIEGYPQVPSLVYIFYGATEVAMTPGMQQPPSHAAVVKLLDQMPASDQPPKELRDILDTPYLQITRGGQSSYGGAPEQFPVFPVEVRIYAPTPERAEGLSRELVSLYKVGLVVPEQQNLLREMKQLSANLQKDRAAIAEVEKKIADTNMKVGALSDYKDVDKAALPTYIAQRRLLDVDTAGTKARIDACDKILKHGASVTEQVEGVKIAAEIELAGLEAKRSAVDKIVESGNRRIELAAELVQLKKSAANLSQRISDDDGGRTYKGVVLESWEKCPVVDGEVTISPVVWRNPNDDAGIRGAN